ncbi:hypothetical protein ACFFX0_31620 [Citricoccus parietis]|uniref:Uncharacterized protein n=1 Tax=Citricoccus parietis TaxID=592307 RepID=A0ABV5GA38_9MICC
MDHLRPGALTRQRRRRLPALPRRRQPVPHRNHRHRDSRCGVAGPVCTGCCRPCHHGRRRGPPATPGDHAHRAPAASLGRAPTDPRSQRAHHRRLPTVRPDTPAAPRRNLHLQGGVTSPDPR